MDIQQRNYPRLYPQGTIPCIKCNSVNDNNEHIGLCPAHSDAISQIMIEFSDILLHLLMDIVDDNKKYGLIDTIKGSMLFNTNFGSHLTIDHLFYLLIHHLVSRDLTDIFIII